MVTSVKEKPRGVLNLPASAGRFALGRLKPSPALADVVEHYWSVRWDLRGEPPHTSEVLSHPAVHVVFERHGAATSSAVHGVVKGKFTRRLEGEGRVFGIKFLPGAFFPLVGFPLSRLTDRVVPLSATLGVDAAALERAILGTDDDTTSAAHAERFLLAHLPARRDAAVGLVQRLVARMAAEAELTSVDALAAESGLGKRRLQRLFNQYVGVGPKWVLRRFRLHEAAEQLERGGAPNLAALAASLGYFDQAHFVRDFKALVGRAPSDYARAVRGAGGPRPTPRPPRSPSRRGSAGASRGGGG